MKRLSGKQLILVGLTLFSMFFGAGNLIFPPFLGVQAGRNVWVAMIGFTVSAIGFPIMGVAAVAKSGGLGALADRVHPKFSFFFTLLIYLSIGPCLAIPRTAGTSFEMAVTPFLAEGTFSLAIAQALYSLAFFALAAVLAFRPDKLTDRLGKILTPCLLTMIVILFIGCIWKQPGNYNAPTEIYHTNPLVKGFLEGYLTMDTIAALNFGIIISLNIQAMGISEEGTLVTETIKAGLIAGGLLLLVYSALAHIGGVTGDSFGLVENGAQTLTRVAQFLFGKPGMILLALIFFIACLNTCVGLLSCCSKYFETILPVLGYRTWVLLFAGISVIVANVGLNTILEFSVPVLNAIYPVAIVLILLAFLHPLIGKYRYTYIGSILLTGITSTVLSLEQVGIRIPILKDVVQIMPFYSLQLGWLLPAIVGLAAGWLLSVITKKC